MTLAVLDIISSTEAVASGALEYTTACVSVDSMPLNVVVYVKVLVVVGLYVKVGVDLNVLIVAVRTVFVVCAVVSVVVFDLMVVNVAVDFVDRYVAVVAAFSVVEGESDDEVGDGVPEEVKNDIAVDLVALDAIGVIVAVIVFAVDAVVMASVAVAGAVLIVVTVVVSVVAVAVAVVVMNVMVKGVGLVIIVGVAVVALAVVAVVVLAVGAVVELVAVAAVRVADHHIAVVGVFKDNDDETVRADVMLLVAEPVIVVRDGKAAVVLTDDADCVFVFN